MIKMLKKNNKGFALVETLITMVFVVAIFSIIFMNFYPLMGEYERRENFDDVESKYAVYWIKRLVESSLKYDTKVCYTNNLGYNCTDVTSYPYKSISCDALYDSGTADYNLCTNLFAALNVDSSSCILTSYNTENVKMLPSTAFVHGLYDYISYLPKYNYVSTTTADIKDSELYQKYRVIAGFNHTAKDGLNVSYDYNTFATIGVNK